MDAREIQYSNSVSLMFAFKVALDQEDYLLCKEIKEELVERKKTGELNDEIIEATAQAYNVHGTEYKDMQYEVFCEMLGELKTI
jgi:hypothetical protein